MSFLVVMRYKYLRVVGNLGNEKKMLVSFKLGLIWSGAFSFVFYSTLKSVQFFVDHVIATHIKPVLILIHP